MHQKMGTATDEQRDYNGTGIIRQYIKKGISDQENQTVCLDPRCCYSMSIFPFTEPPYPFPYLSIREG